MTDERDENWFLAQVEKAQVDVDMLVDYLERLRAEGQKDQAESRAELLQDTLAEKDKTNEALRILELRASWVDSKTGVALIWQEEAQDILGNAWEQKALVEQARSERIISAREGIRRLRLLRSLEEDSLCYDRTWGLGKVTRVDFFNKRLEIDFERKLGHQLSMSYAAETLQKIDDTHILVWKHRRAEELKALVQKDPAEVVRMALRSFGPLSVASLQQTLGQGIVSETEWKKFWDSARKELKKDQGVVIPAGRTEAMRLLDKSQSRDSNWFDDLQRERALDKVVARFEDLAEGRAKPEITDTAKRILADRLQFVLIGATAKERGFHARVLMAADQIKLDLGDRGNAIKATFFDPPRFAEIFRLLPSKPSRQFLRYLNKLDSAKTNEMLARLVPVLDIGSFNEAASFLIENKQEEILRAAFRTALDQRKPSVEQVSWLSRFTDKIDEWGITPAWSWIMMMIDHLEESYNGDRLKAQNQLRERFARQDWLAEITASLDDRQRRQLMLRVKESGGWSMLDKQPVMANLVRLYPELEAVLAEKNEKERAEAAPVRGVFTSLRSYKERQVQLEKLVTIEIPRIAKDIGIARSYGDLRENFEFKAAKEAQTVAMRKRDELSDMLAKVTPTDFKGYPSDKAGLATTVVIEYPDAATEKYFILGEWDGDPQLGIISCNSRLAQSLEGKKPGDEVMVTTEQGEMKCRVTEVGPLPAHIQEWVEGTAKVD